LFYSSISYRLSLHDLRLKPVFLPSHAPIALPLIRLLPPVQVKQTSSTCIYCSLDRILIPTITTAMTQEQRSSHPKPDEAALREASELEVFDENGNATTFDQLYNAEGRRVIVFIRHFFCGVSG
jgi:hypothetical protein